MQPTQLGPNNAVVPAAAANIGTFPATGASSSVFDGEVVYQTLSLSLSSHPTHEVDTRLYYNWAKEDNNSTHMVFTPFAPAVAGNSASGGSLLGGAASNCSSAGSVTGAPPFGDVPCTPELFGYRKHNLGIEAGWRVNRENKLTGGYDFYDIERDRFDFHGNQDHKLYAEWKNTSIEELTARAKYQDLSRDSDWNVSSAVTGFNPTELYVRRYDLANVNQNLGKIVLDWSPRPFLDSASRRSTRRTTTRTRRSAAPTTSGRNTTSRLRSAIPLVPHTRLLRHRVPGIQLDAPRRRVHSGGLEPGGSAIRRAHERRLHVEGEERGQGLADRVGRGVEAPRPAVADGLADLRGNRRHDGLSAERYTAQPAVLLPDQQFRQHRALGVEPEGHLQGGQELEPDRRLRVQEYKYSDIGYDNTRYVVPPLTTSALYVTGQSCSSRIRRISSTLARDVL